MILAAGIAGLRQIGPVPRLRGQAVSFEVTWLASSDAPDACDRQLAGDALPGEGASQAIRLYDGLTISPPRVTGFYEVLTIRNAANDIVLMVPLRGLFTGGTGGAPLRCVVQINTTLTPSAGHTIWIEDTYIASIPPEGFVPDVTPQIVLSD